MKAKFIAFSMLFAVVACTEEMPKRPGGQSGDGTGATGCKPGENCDLKPDTPAQLMNLWKGKDLVFMGADDKPAFCMSSQNDFSKCTIYDIKTKTKKNTKCDIETTGGKKTQNIRIKCVGTKTECAGFEGFEVDHGANFSGSEVSVGERGNYANFRESGACESVMNGGSGGPVPAGKELVATWEIPCKPNGFLSDKVEYIFGGNGEGTYNWTVYDNCEAGDRDFVMSAAFAYTSGQEAVGGRALNITVKSVKITPISASMVDDFNQSKNCGISDWVMNKPREVTANCEMGTSLKKDQKFFNLYKVEDKKLFLGIQQLGGQTTDPGHDGSTEAQRPIRLDTANPLVQPGNK